MTYERLRAIHFLTFAGDDARAKQIVMKLIDEIGFDAVNAGTIEESWRQQPGSPV